MSVTNTYPFDNPANYIFDADKVQVTGGAAFLKLEADPGKTFEQLFSSDVGFTYDSIKAEFVGGLVQQKDQRPTDATFGVTYTSSINGSWGAGVLTGTASGGAAIVGGKLDLAHDDIRYVDYGALGNADSQQTGCIKFKITPNYSGTTTERSIFSITKEDSSSINRISLRHGRLVPSPDDRLRLLMYDGTGTVITITDLGSWSVTQSQEYEVEINWDITTGATRVFIDGVQIGATITATGIRSSDLTLLRIGADPNGSAASNSYMEDIIIFDTVQHTANYTPGYTLPESAYEASVVGLPSFISTPGCITSLDSFAVTESGAPKYILDDKYWSGSTWISSNGSYTQASFSADVISNINTLEVCATLDIDIIYPDSNVISTNDVLTVGYAGQIYSTASPTLEIAQNFNIDALISFIETTTVTGADKVKYILKKDNSWYYYDGSNWVVSDETYAQSNPAETILTNISTFTTSQTNFNIRIFLHSTDGSTTPAIQQLVVTYNFSGDDASDAFLCSVYWYARNPDGSVCMDQVYAIPSINNVRYKDNIFICQEKIYATPNSANGYVKINLIENVNMIGPSGESVVYKVFQGDSWFATISVPVEQGALLWDIIDS